MIDSAIVEKVIEVVSKRARNPEILEGIRRVSKNP